MFADLTAVELAALRLLDIGSKLAAVRIVFLVVFFLNRNRNVFIFMYGIGKYLNGDSNKSGITAL